MRLIDKHLGHFFEGAAQKSPSYAERVGFFTFKSSTMPISKSGWALAPTMIQNWKNMISSRFGGAIFFKYLHIFGMHY